jgi:hypothetical protein
MIQDIFVEQVSGITSKVASIKFVGGSSLDECDPSKR